MNKYGKFLAVLGSIGVFAGVCFAAALTDDRDTPSRSGRSMSFTQGSNIIYAGSIVVLNGSGVAVPASDASGVKVVGRAMKRYDNTAGNYSATAIVEVERGTFRWANGGSFTNTDIGAFAYALDDQTCFTAAQATNDIIVGLIVDVDQAGQGVWVDTLSAGGQGASSLSSLTVSGAGTVGGLLTYGSATSTGSLTTGSATVNGASTLNTATITGTAVNVAGNLGVTGTVAVTGDAGFQDVNAGKLTLATNRFIITGAVAAGPTNLIVADGVGILITGNGTNYIIRATPN